MSAADHIDFLKRLKAQGHEFEVIYDVGANIGEWSVDVQQLFPDARFELFEALAGRFAGVDDNLMVDQLRDAALHPVALSDESGAGEIKILGDGGVGSSILLLPADRRRDDFEIIPCQMSTMDDYVSANDLKSPDFIKIDTQASELKILNGAKETISKAKFILIETWMRRIYGPDTPLIQEISSWLYDHDFMLYEFIISEAGRDADGALRWLDAVYINKAASPHPAWML